MKFTYDWLKDYLNTDLTPAQIADVLTRIGLEVEDVIEPVAPIVARIVECEKHPDSDHLNILKVDDGSGALRAVVCGAPNARAGLLSALAIPGCKIGDMEIKSGKIRGVLSDGMMCSARELGIGDNHDGIIELNPDNEIIGQRLSIIDYQLSTVFDAGITPNRPDYLAVRGIAIDLAAAGAGNFIKEDMPELPNVAGNRRVIIKNEHACPTYRLAEIHGIKNGPSNPVIASRLSAIGINPKNTPIDATNYICYDLAQPLHCFDADEIVGDIVVRLALAGEKFVDLFGTEHELVETDLVITDDKGILALAGVVGGMRGSVTDDTKNILLESAYFNPVTVRKTSKRIGVSTDASYRYERGIDPTVNELALQNAIEIITRACGGEIVGTYVAGRTEFTPKKIEYNPGLFVKKTGIEMPADTQKSILESLGFVIDANGDNWTVTPTPARVDVEIAENIVSELIRLYGYDNIKQDKNTGKIEFQTTIPAVKRILVSRGFYECMNYGFGDAEKEKILSTRENIPVLNPIIDTFNTARNSLIQSMLDTIVNNDRFNRSNMSLFELAPVFDGAAPNQQHDQLVIARTGISGDKIGIKHGVDVSVYDVCADLIALFPDAVVQNDDTPPMWAHPYRAGRLVLGDKTVAVFAQLHPAVAKKFGIKTNVVIGLVDNVSEIMSPVGYDITTAGSDNKIPMAEFPLITRDFAFVAQSDVLPDALTDVARSADSRIIETNVFDVFDLQDGKKSIAFEIVIQPVENMTDADLLLIQNTVINAIESKTGAKLRA